MDEFTSQLEHITSDEDARVYQEDLKIRQNLLKQDIMMKYTLGSKQSDLAIKEYLVIRDQLTSRSVSEDRPI